MTRPPLVGSALWNTVMANAGHRSQCEGACGSKHDPDRLRRQGRCLNSNGDTVSKRRHGGRDGVVRLIAMPRNPETEGDFVTAAQLPAERLTAMCPQCYDAVRRAIKAAAAKNAPAMDDLFDTTAYRVGTAGGERL
ncbi:hypothetical protein ABZ208_35515 [Streptomyces sp. NPDC006208]|uniref:hypothetical protein n=1 Tax=Streptomyces sp. NPDC006208 TaxID=3156734 RepID=UPI0033B95CB9